MITLKIVDRNNKKTDITQLVEKVTWSGDYKQASRKLEFSIISNKYDKKIPIVDIKEGYMVFFYEDKKELFRGFIYSIEKTADTTSYMAYDHAQKLVNIKVNYNFKNKTASQITTQMLDDYSKYGLKKGSIVSDGVSWSKVFIGVSMYDTIMSAYTNSHASNGKEYMCYAKEGEICTALKGDIKLDVQFKEKENIISTTYKSSIEDVVNRVIIVDDSGNKIGEEKNSNSIDLYGLFQEVVKAESQTSETTQSATSEISTMAVSASTSSTTKNNSFSLNTTNSIAKSIFDFCIGKGCTPQVAAAIVANAECESSFNTSSVNSIGASGLLQWLGGRLTSLKRKASKKGVSWTNLNLQLEHMWDELSGEESTTVALLNSRVGGLSKFMKLTDPYKAGYEFGKCFERGGYNEKRGNTAKNWYSKVVVGGKKISNSNTSTDVTDNNQTTTTTVIDLESARKEAKKKLNDRERSASLDGYGDTTCITGYGVTVTDSSTGLKGLFYIDTDSHTWENGEYKIALNLNYKNLMNEVEAGEDEEKQETIYNDNNYNDGKKVLNGKKVKALFTAYYPANTKMEGGFYDSLGNRLDPSKRTCAAPKSIPFHTKIQPSGTGSFIDGKTYTVTDRGKAIKVVNGVYHIDILMSSAAECNRFGKKYGYIIIGDGTGYKEVPATSNLPLNKKQEKLISVAKAKLGTPYVWGASINSTTSFDCSSFTRYVYKTALGITLQRTSNVQGEQGKKITSTSQLQAGDLIYFNTYSTDRANGITHVGMYIGNGQMIHASYSYKKVMIVNLKSYLSYRGTKFIWARRHI